MIFIKYIHNYLSIGLLDSITIMCRIKTNIYIFLYTYPVLDQMKVKVKVKHTFQGQNLCRIQ